MKKTLLCALAILLSLSGFAQQQLWHTIRESDKMLSQKCPRDSHPKEFLLYSLNLAALKSQLAHAPMRYTGQMSQTVIALPDADGIMEHFRMYNAPVMAAGLSAKYPGIQSYTGQGIEHPSSAIRISTTLFGFHAMALTTGSGAWYIDPYTKDAQNYIVYKKSSLQTNKVFTCLTHNEALQEHLLPKSAAAARSVLDNGNARTYRLAVLATVEYSAFHIAEAGLQDGTPGQKTEAVLAAIAVTITRVNSMYERDFSVSLQLIDNEDAVIFVDSDTVNNDDAGALLNEGNAIIYDTIGTDNFDMGHSFGTGGGGLAAGAPCSDFKAGAMTGIGSPVGDSFDIDYVAHEMGHQFGAGHTFNDECGGNRADDLAYEPGGGTTIMGYAGVCDPSIQQHSDAQFHAISIAQIRQRINNESNCVPLIATGNTPPEVNAGPDFIIPKGTPFILEGESFDSNGDSLSYDWEQMNKEISTQPPVATAAGGPNFRSLPITGSPNRFMPAIESVLVNDLAPEWEVIPTVARTLDFALTVRDNSPLGGEATTDYMHIDVNGTAGPFKVTSPNSAVTWVAASNKTITWDVAGTTENGVNTPYVDIFLSTDGGFTYPVTLASTVPNDGSENIIVPNLPGQGRIMVRGHNNIFYDIGNANFTITAAGSTFLATVPGSSSVEICKGSGVSFLLNYQRINGFTGTTAFTAAGNPPGSTLAVSPAQMSTNGNVEVILTNTANSPVGDYNIVVTMTSGTEIKTVTLHVSLLSTDFAQLQAVSPEPGSTTLPTTLTLDWSTDIIASSYHLQVATDAPFNNIVADVVTTTSSYDISLEESTTYYWRVLSAHTGCEGSYSDTFTFQTGDAFCNEYASADVPLGIDGGDPSTGTTTIEVDADFVLQNMQVTMNISHSWISDVVATLISPAGTQVLLFGNQCNDWDNASVTFSDTGAPLTCNSGELALTGNLAPQQLLGQLAGESVNGTWTLQIADTQAGDGGAVNSWSINLCGLQQAPLGTPAYTAISGMAVYPNPSNGTFTLQYTTLAAGPATISVYDIRGRQIYGETYASGGGLTLKQLNLEAQAGVYILNLEQGGQKATRKVVVQ